MMSGSLMLVLPEEIISTAALLLMLGAAWGGNRSARVLTWLAILTLAGSAAFLPTLRDAGGTAFGGLFIADSFAAFAKIVIHIAAAVSLVAAMSWSGATRIIAPNIRCWSCSRSPAWT